MPGIVNGRGTEEQRFWRKVKIVENGCWEWQAGKHKFGYGMFGLETKVPHQYPIVTAHTYVYKKYVGPIPEGLELDHLCRNPSCVNPLHLEPVTPHENKRRGVSPIMLNFNKTHCIRGHELSGANVYVNPNTNGRYCRACRKIREGKAYV